MNTKEVLEKLKTIIEKHRESHETRTEFNFGYCDALDMCIMEIDELLEKHEIRTNFLLMNTRYEEEMIGHL